MEARQTEALLMLDGLKKSIRRVREDLSVDFDPVVTARLGNAEMDIDKAVAVVHSTHPHSGP